MRISTSYRSSSSKDVEIAVLKKKTKIIRHKMSFFPPFWCPNNNPARASFHLFSSLHFLPIHSLWNGHNFSGGAPLVCNEKKKRILQRGNTHKYTRAGYERGEWTGFIKKGAAVKQTTTGTSYNLPPSSSWKKKRNTFFLKGLVVSGAQKNKKRRSRLRKVCHEKMPLPHRKKCKG